jgi:hypothetical protein
MLGATVTTDDRRGRGTDDDEGVVYMTRKAAATYLSRKLGRPVSVSAMKRWAHEGWGPRFTLILRRASYTRVDLDEWIAGPDAQRRPGGYRPRKPQEGNPS